ncbi:hypothetical protein [Endozoicomonas sp. Mp262]|uniref:lipopolysaccharide kinase InaA family protein n=1 Tax=Endozoicomonas sp. Mp262 TaxID=2919499 RepID=UPI0021D9CB4F
MISLNEFLIHKTDEERCQWLNSYLKEVTKLHQNRQAATLEITVTSTSEYTLEIASLPNSSLTDNKWCIANLIDCLTRLYPRYDRYLSQLWHPDSFIKDYPPLKTIEKRVYKKRKAREKNLKHCFENNTHFQVSKSWNHYQVIQKAFDGPELTRLLQAPDQAIAEGEILKDCKATTVSLYKMANGQKVIIKRYNSKGTAYSLTRSLIDSRARVCWQGALLLDQIGISTPKNLAMLEVRQGPWIKTSYLITEFKEGETLSDLYREEHEQSSWPTIARQVEDILLTYPRVRVAHGDFKATNFIIDKNQPIMIDLDSFRSCSFFKIFKDTYFRDLDRFERNWVRCPSAMKLFTPIIQNARYSCLSATL